MKNGKIKGLNDSWLNAILHRRLMPLEEIILFNKNIVHYLKTYNDYNNTYDCYL